MRDIGIGVVGGGYMGKAHSVAMAAVGAVVPVLPVLRPRGQVSEPIRWASQASAWG